MTLSIPKPRQERLNEFNAAVCPKCDVWIILRDQDGSYNFSEIEYQKHYKKAHKEPKKK